jgi:hypothetical protein
MCIQVLGCGKTLKYTYTNLQCQILQKFVSSLHIKNSSTEQKEGVCRYFLKAALNFAMSFLRIVSLGGKPLKVFMPA